MHHKRNKVFVLIKATECDNAGRNDDYGGIDTDDDGGNDTDDDGGNVTDDDDDGDDPGPPLGSTREPGLQERAALHGRRTVWPKPRDHTHTGLSLSVDTATVGSQPHSIAVDKQHGLSSTSDDRVSFSHPVAGQVVTDCQDSLVHTDHSHKLSAKARLCVAERLIDLRLHIYQSGVKVTAFRRTL
ncbi:hypothetical protein ElyMa_002444700 [Elysia marginata]|uniref:Uncharacterized protein n=1 Tax=Elysia marginata TaxID=1093978 RepID=A0AAV4GIL6_9GAST|nr:hypothetical protein ElyMa_002444700 [Elysia marginata]